MCLQLVKIESNLIKYLPCRNNFKKYNNHILNLIKSVFVQSKENMVYLLIKITVLIFIAIKKVNKFSERCKILGKF